MAIFDIVWNPVTRDIEFSSNGDISVSNEQSVISTQNGMVLLEGRAMNILQPGYGIGFDSQVLGNDEAQAAFQLNRWTSQVNSDSGNANWVKIPNPPGVNFDFEAKVSY